MKSTYKWKRKKQVVTQTTDQMSARRRKIEWQ
jgi:hypothetical protein